MYGKGRLVLPSTIAQQESNCRRSQKCLIKKAAAQLTETVVGIIREFCSERVCGDARILNKALFNKIKDSVLFTNFDGAPYAQLSGVQLCREHVKKH